jgi:hypothetical protein
MNRRTTALLAALALATPAIPAALAQTPSPAFQAAILGGLDAPTRAEVERRATGGNSVYEVLRVILLNNMQAANLIRPGEAPLSEVVAIDFIREHAVVRQGDNLRVLNFDRATLNLKP